MDLIEQLWRFIAILIPAALIEIYASELDYTENIELKQMNAGYNILLHCEINGLASEKVAAVTKIYWFFKQRQEKLVNEDNCHDWKQLPCEENFCKSDLLLRNVTEEYSGLYKCTVVPLDYKSDKALDIQFVRTYQLEVKNKDMTAPKFIDADPVNKTGVVGAQVVFQCRVQSEEHLSIKWFRRLSITSDPNHLLYAGVIGSSVNNENFNTHIVKYNEHTYELLHTGREKYIGDDVYLSKMILNGVRLQDVGYYACAAISYHGYKIREAYLDVIKQENVEFWTSYDGNGGAFTDPQDFWILFLMPLGLALLPLLVWLSYLAYKRHLARAEVKRKSNICSDGFTEGDNCVLRI